MTWLLVSRGFYRSRDGRFDVWLSDRGAWWVTDAVAGRVARFRSEANAKAWCERRAGQ